MHERRTPTRCSCPAAKSESGPPGRRDGTAGRLLHAADPARAGPARPGHRRHRRGIRGRQPLRAARATGRTSRGRPPPPARTSSTPSPRSSASRTAHAHGAVHALPLQGRVPGDGDAHPDQRDHARTRGPVAARRPTRSRRSGRCTASSTSAAPSTASRWPSPASARPTSTRPTRRAAFADFNRPSKVKNVQDFQQRRLEDRLHLQLVLRRRQGHRLLQLGRQPRSGPTGSSSDLPELGHRRVRLEGLRTRPSRPPTYTPVRRAPAGRSTRATSRPGTTSRRPASPPPTATASYGPIYRSQSLDVADRRSGSPAAAR